MTDGTLFEDYTTTGRDHPETSHQAAVQALGRAGSQRRYVFAEIMSSRDGLTDDELSTRLVLPGNSVRPRRRELQRAGVIKDSGERRRNAAGNPCIVWRIA